MQDFFIEVSIRKKIRYTSRLRGAVKIELRKIRKTSWINKMGR